MPVATVLRRVAATRYATTLREGGSLAGLVETDADGLYVVAFTGAGQGSRALAAEAPAPPRPTPNAQRPTAQRPDTATLTSIT